MRPDDPRHGEERGYFAHRKDGEDACEACLRAHSKADKRRQLQRLATRPNLVPSRNSQRRIRALNAIGWTCSAIAKEAGWTSHSTVRRILTIAQVRASSADRIAEVYERLHMTPGPSDLVRKRSRAAGDPPPLAWDDIDRDREPVVTATLCSVPDCARAVVAHGICHPHYKARAKARAA